tara:strand:- start:252 stop:959 length:708 start_codon:yes stop_codon:yes gene_type:complete
VNARSDRPNRNAVKPSSKAGIATFTPEEILANERERVRRENEVSKRNVTLSLIALASVVGTLILSWTITPLHGYFNLDEETRVIEISGLDNHDAHTEPEVFNFVAKAVTECMTFTYQTMSNEILRCTGTYLSSAGRSDFDKLLIEKFIDVSKKYFFDVETKITHAPALINSEQKNIYGRAAWKVTVPASIILRFDKTTRRDNIEKDWLIVVWVVREYKSIKRSGLALHSISMMEQ